jgi:hypothetical protein
LAHVIPPRLDPKRSDSRSDYKRYLGSTLTPGYRVIAPSEAEETSFAYLAKTPVV